MEDTLLAEELIYSLLVPAIHEMILKFNDVTNLYKSLMELLLTIMETDYPASAFERFNFSIRDKHDISEESSDNKDMTGEYKM
jgi:hypothetical protein